MSYHPFANVEMAPPDPILGINEMFQKDAKPEKVNLSVGIYLDAKGICPVLSAVKQAEKMLLEQENTKQYLGIAGETRFAGHVQELIFGLEHPVVKEGRATTAHTPGGTGALRVGADFIGGHFSGASVWISDPSWSNHKMLFGSAGFPIKSYPYLDAKTHRIDFKGMLAALEEAPEGDVVLLHGCCHNPTGIDPTPAQWDELVALFSRRALIPFIDLAYQGMGSGLEEDAYAVRAFGAAGLNFLVASSFSKSFGLYRERVGAITLVTDSAQEAERALSNLKICVRTNYSSPPAHGGMVVDTVLTTPELRAQWLEELDGMRERIQGMRALFVDTLKKVGVERDFAFLNDQKGMFSYTGITGEPVLRLRDKYGVYMLESGRINVAGITPDNVDYLCRSIAAVLQEG